MTTNLLSQKAVISDLVIRRWTGRKHDRKITDKVNEEYESEADAGRWNKLLLPKKAFSGINKIVSQARKKHLVMTLPWSDAGYRILPTALYDDFTKTFRIFRIDFQAAADEFAQQYPGYLATAKNRLKKAYNADDFPHPDRVRRKYDFYLSFKPCPTEDDFRTNLAKEQMDDIRDNLREEIERTIGEAMKEPIRRVIHTVTKMAEKLRAYDEDDRTFRDSIVGNVRAILPLLDAFNLKGDKSIAKLAQQVETKLCAYDADELREDDDARAKVTKAADDILKQAQAMMA